MGWHLFADDVEEEVATGIAEEFELLAEVFDDVVEIAMGSKITSEVAVFGVEFDDALGVVDDCGEFSAVADDACVLPKFVEFLFRHARYPTDFEFVKCFVCGGPFGVDDTPRHAALEYGFGHDLEVVVKGLDLDLWWCAFFVGHGWDFLNCDWCDFNDGL